MTQDIPKNYDSAQVESRRYANWVAHGCFKADPARVSASRPAYSVVIPPPNVTGVLHMGHVLNNTIQDILVRCARLEGKEVLWLPGTDHAGIATQVMVEKQLKKTEGKTRRDLGREEFLKRVWDWKKEKGGIIISQLKKLGCSCDWSRERFTMDEAYTRCIQKIFVDLYEKGYIYRGKRMVNWCPATLTALSDEEYHAKYVQEIKNTRRITEHFLDSIGWKYIKSSSNFILLTPNKNGAECPEIAAEFAAFLRSKKILARYFASDPSVNMSIRLTIGTPEQMQTVMDAITQWTNI